MRFVQGLEQLRRWSTEKLQSEILRCRGRERVQTATLIAHLSEIDHRELYSLWGYSSLFVYCTNELGHSEAEAYLRIQVARIARRHPIVLDQLSAGTLSLSVAAVISPVLSPANAEKILDRAKGMTKLQAKELVAEYRPRPLVRSGVRRKPRPSVETATQSAGSHERVTALPFHEDPDPTSATAADLGSAHEGADRPKAQIEPAACDAFNFRFSADRTLKDKIERLSEVLGVKDPFGALEQIVAKAVDIALDQKDPERLHERRVKRKQARVATTADPECEPQKAPSSAESPGAPKRRAIPAAVRGRVLQRAEYRCEHRSGSRRCTERTGLQIDHRVPHGKGGSDDEPNLQVLCESHNRWKAKQDYGREYVEGKIAESQVARSRLAEDRAVQSPSTQYADSQPATQGPSLISEGIAAYRAAPAGRSRNATRVADTWSRPPGQPVSQHERKTNGGRHALSCLDAKSCRNTQATLVAKSGGAHTGTPGHTL